MTDEEWQQRLRAAVEKTLRKRADRAAQRREFADRRAVGLQRRHRQKLNRQTPNYPKDAA